MGFFEEKQGDIIIEIVQLSRATVKEAAEFKEICLNDIQLGWKKIIIDLTPCEFIDSTFLGSLVVCLKKVNELGGGLRLIGFHPNVNSLFELTGLHRVFESYKTKEEAIKSFN